MRWTDRLSLPQKIVIVIALGLALGAIGESIPSLVVPAGMAWYSGAGPAFQSALSIRLGLPGWISLIVWLVLIAVWTLLSLRILRPAPEQPPRP